MIRLAHIYMILFCCLIAAQTSYAQISDSNATVFEPINENLFVNTKWRYTYTTHAQSNTVIHKADESYHYFIFFKYDYVFQTHLNGKLIEGVWKLNKEQNELRYHFRKIEWWRLASFSEEALVLEYTLNRKSSYRYHFVRVDDEDAPFVRDPNDLPDVNVNFAKMQENTEDDAYFSFLENRGVAYNKNKWEQRKARKVRKEKKRIARLNKTKKGRARLAKESPKETLQVELVGGGFYGGIDPVYRNTILIKTDGRVIREYQSEMQGLIVNKHTISRDSLEKLVSFIEDKKFFEFDQIYTCNNKECLDRLADKPRPIALRIAITKGVRRKLITIPIWEGNGRKNALVDYPEELDIIVHAIETIALSSNSIQ